MAWISNSVDNKRRVQQMVWITNGVDNKCLQVKNFKYLGRKTSYENGKDVEQKPAKYAEILGILNNTFKPNLVQKFSRIKACNALAAPIPLYGSENWTLIKKG